jgi:sterol-4alpha-carboxylate 3-dehydrogenase (decarboxylating)
MGSQYDHDNGGRRRETRWCAVTGGRGFMARHLVAALLRSGEWRVRVTDLAPSLVLGPGETVEIFSDALRDGRAVYASVDVCNLEQLIKGNKYIHILLDDSCRRVFFNTYTCSFFFRNIQSHFSCEI